MRKPVKFLIVFVVSIPVLVALYFFENIQGYYKFKQYCAKEGGLKVYDVLDENKGWQVLDSDDFLSIMRFSEVGFVTYIDEKNGDKYIFEHVGGSKSLRSSYKRRIADKMSDEIEYIWYSDRKKVPKINRLYSTNYYVKDKDTEEILVKYTYFVYSILEQEKTLLAAPSYVYCYNDDSEMISKFKSVFVQHKD